MARRRMISNNVINSAKFLKMPSETQALYFHLCMNADDDGVCEAFTVMRLVGSSEDNIRVLQAKNFVKVLNEDLVSYIMDWNEHNLLRADRKINSVYKELLLQIMPDIELVEPKQRADRKKNMGLGYNGTSQGQPKDGLVKYSGVETSKVKKSGNKKKSTTFIPPTLDMVIDYFKEKGYKEDVAKKAFDGYDVADRHDSYGKKIYNWKQKMINVWFKEEHEDKKYQLPTTDIEKAHLYVKIGRAKYKELFGIDETAYANQQRNIYLVD